MVLGLAIAAAGLVWPQTAAAPQKGTFERVKVHGKSLEGNLGGDSPDRDVSIYLPPGYAADRNRRYPVIYLLHGYTNSDEGWFGPNVKSGFQSAATTLPAVADQAISAGTAREMIIIMPNAYTVYQGSMYSNSVTTGNWEAYLTRDLVEYVDSHYRTIPERASRGLAGHSMGGYGTIRIAMKYPEVFSSIYILSGCCLTPSIPLGANSGVSTNAPASGQARAEAIHSPAELANADRGVMTTFAEAAAWSPNPQNPPFFLDLPAKDGKPQPAVIARWAANAPLAMIDQYVPNLKKLHAIAIDVGDKDGLRNSNQELSRILAQYGISNKFEIYDGDHTNRIAARIETKVLPFFSAQLLFGAGKK
jgi:enterochelin esterase-like enzyme